nr:disease resistance protein RPM1-like [Ipomoea batatas]
MAEAAVEFLLDQLSAVISKECSLLGGIREDAQYIMDALSRLRAALRVADEREEIDPQVNAWVKIVRELAYDTEDVLDEFLFHFGGRHTGGGFFTKMKNKYNSAKNLRTQHRLALALQKIKARISENSQYQPILPTTTVHNHNQQLHGRVGALFQEDSDLVGFENSKQSLIKLLLGAVDDDLRVHSVVGMGGLGKTTLVKKAYDDAQVTMHFQRRVWVTVSETFKIEELLKDVIKKLGNPPNGDSTDELIQSVRDILSEQRYIIVFDDVWSFDVWRDIKYAFTRQKFGSRVVITTRNSEIGRNACHETQGDVYELKHLSEKDSWELFCKKTFLSDSCPPHLVNIAEDIVNKCGGLPLAIVVIAGIMATKGEDIAEWKNFQLKTDDRMKNLENLLSLSYYDLPYYLKYCFLYFSIFPEDAIIKKNRVIKLWIAEGFVKEKGQQVKEEVAEAYLNELIHRNLIQIADKSHAGKIIGLRVHDILREIILSKALEQNFAVILTRQNKEWSDDKCRRLIIHGFDDDILKSTSSKSHIRSLQLYHDEVLVSFSFSKLLSFDYYIPLKVLDLRGNSLKKIPKEVFKLFHLKYLGLRRTWLRHVSKSIGLLQNLEVLDLKGTWVKNLPIEVEKLDKLRNLIVGWCGFYAHFRIRRLLFLQELRYVQAKKTNGLKVVSEIGNLTQLRKLGVKGLRQEDGKELCSSIEKLTNLISLNLKVATENENEILDIQHSLSTVPLCLRTLKLYGRLERIPQWLSSLVSLTKLELWYSCVLEDPLLLLHDLPMLAHLRLYKSYEGEGLCFKAGKFPKLKFLDIALSRALRWIMVEEGAMPNLEELWLHDCRSLEQCSMLIELCSADGFLVGFVSKKPIWAEGHTSKSIKVEEKRKCQKCEMDCEGFVKEKGQQVKEDVAEAYLNELIHRNLIQIPEKSSPVGRVTGLRVHDILQEIILSMALEQNFAVIITEQNKEWSDKCQRLIIHRSDDDKTFDDSILKIPSSKILHLRSLQFYAPRFVVLSGMLLNQLSVDYIPLKVLDLRYIRLYEIPKEVFKLFHLKYLSLRDTRLRYVSKSIGLLQNLETLDLKNTLVEELPIEIVKLHKLRHLIIIKWEWMNPQQREGFNAPFEIGGLLSLQKLCNIRAKATNGVRVVSEIGNLKQLKKLEVTNLRQEDGKELCSCIEKLTNLISLRLEAAGARTGANEILDIQHSLSTIPLCLQTLKLFGCLVERIPKWLSSLVGLTKLELWYSCVLEDPLPLLQNLPMLAHLRLVESYEGEGLYFKAGKFPKLKFLDIALFRELKWIMVDEGAMPLLEELFLSNCNLLEQVPFGIQHLSKLHSIAFHYMNNKLMLTLKPNAENYTKISHIPHIEIVK